MPGFFGWCMVSDQRVNDVILVYSNLLCIEGIQQANHPLYLTHGNNPVYNL